MEFDLGNISSTFSERVFLILYSPTVLWVKALYNKLNVLLTVLHSIVKQYDALFIQFIKD
jgi:hypothetical protein